MKEEMNETYRLEHLETIDEEIDDNNEATEIVLVTPGSGRNVRFQGKFY